MLLTLKLVYCAEIFYVLAISFIKFSILLFYQRIFPTPNFVITLWIIGTITLTWTIAGGLSFVFQCSPVSKTWNPNLNGKCVDIIKLFVGNAIPNIVTDFAIIIAPIPMIFKLRIAYAQKIALCVVFLMGGMYDYSNRYH